MGVTHHLLSEREPTSTFDVRDFVTLAEQQVHYASPSMHPQAIRFTVA